MAITAGALATASVLLSLWTLSAVPASAPAEIKLAERLDRLAARIGATEHLTERIDALETDGPDDARQSGQSSDTSHQAVSGMNRELRQTGVDGPASEEYTEPVTTAVPPLRPRYVAIHTSHDAVTVEQNETGHLIARNTDPAMTMKQIVVDAEQFDGSVVRLVITVPPPDE
jgi:hypothetical protein